MDTILGTTEFSIWFNADICPGSSLSQTHFDIHPALDMIYACGKWGIHSMLTYFEFNSSILVTSPLIHEIIQQCTHFSATVLSDQHQAKADVVSSRHQQQASIQSIQTYTFTSR